jgi:tetratricopeptide (TPR) repeat protein
MTDLMAQGIEEFRAENYTEAIALFTSVIEADPDPSDTYTWRAWSLYHQEEYRQAILDCTKSLDLTPTDFAYWVLGRIYEEMGEFRLALDSYTNAVTIASHDAINYASRAGIWDKLGDFKKAVEDYSSALELDPANTYNWLLRAYAYQALDMEPEALADFLRVQELDPEREGLAEQIEAIQSRLNQ